MAQEMDPKTAGAEQPIELRWLAEFFCWTMVALAPVLTWVNGPAVSTDQFVVRTAVFCLALAGALGLRVASVIGKIRSRRKASGQTVPGDETPS